MAWDIYRESKGIAVWVDDTGERYRVTGVDRQRGQVTSVLDRDCPSDGGQWCARLTDRGIEYVTSRSLARSTAMRHFRRIMRQGWC